ncbi:HAD family hydrolase [Nitratifractor sp.]
MIRIEIPDFRTFELEHLVLDYNGTIARDGALLEGVPEALGKLRDALAIHVLTADTFGNATEQLSGIGITPTILEAGDHTLEKARIVGKLGADRCVAIGNGSNDTAMLEAAALGIAVCGSEGLSTQLLTTAEVLAPGIVEALELLIFPKRLVATLRR